MEFLKNISELSTISMSQAVITIFTAFILGAIISVTYRKTTNRAEYSQDFFFTLIMIPTVVAIMIFLIGSNVATAFSLAGAFSIVRFRSTPGNPKDIAFIFFTMAAGLACGLGCYIYAVLFTVVLCLAMLVLCGLNIGAVKKQSRVLKITIPENLNFDGAFDDILEKYTSNYTLLKVKTADMGSVFELVYDITMQGEVNQKEFIDKIRCRNGNLTVLLTMGEYNS
jgi:hypothetical protein